MSRDCYVAFRREDDIARSAGDVRRIIGCDALDQFDVVNAVGKLVGRRFGANGFLNLEIFDGIRDLGFAYVTFDPLIMHIDNEIWSHASMGDPHSRHIIAHEIGHAVLHDRTAKKFSNKENQFGIYGMEEHSGEWQAETFASHLLIPDQMAMLFSSVQPLATHAGTPLKYASERLGDVHRRRTKIVSNASHCTETCIGCGNFAMIANGLITRCEFCGNTTAL